MAQPLRVLFLCTGNSARSQLAEAWLRQLGGPDFEVFSAGTQPKGIHPLTTAVLADAGIDSSGQSSKHLEQYLGERFDYIITVCDRARDACPVFPGDYQRIHWSFDDPASPEIADEARRRAFDRVSGEIKQRVQLFVNAHRSAPAR